MSHQLYTDTTIDHFKSPRNIGRMDDADGVGMVGDPACGDFLTIYIKVVNQVIEDVSYLVFGCAAAIASGSMTTELAKGKTVAEA
ncbi:MAG: iron-sulfur cluster assembly scaffold protein, partial [Peptococcaceae bacterium]|nr:iron-sulfur cluster assembly scaffold protein [Peptococcaceae bacterium]